MKQKIDLFKLVQGVPIRDLRVRFNSLRKDYLITGRVSYLTRLSFVACINLGYAIESYLKQGLIELGNKNTGLQKSHDLKKLFNACVVKGLYKNIEVSEDFLDYCNSVFQMRYPSSTINECLRAYQRDKIINLSSDYILAYDDLIAQLDEALLDYTEDYYSSSIVFITCNINEHSSRLFYHHNLYALKRFEKYKEIVIKNYPNNKSAINELNNGPDYFWSYDKTSRLFYVSIAEAESLHPKPAKGFKFPGTLIRNAEGKVISWSSATSLYTP